MVLCLSVFAAALLALEKAEVSAAAEPFFLAVYITYTSSVWSSIQTSQPWIPYFNPIQYTTAVW
jgi:uncharacterized membrane protein YhhN